MMGLRVRRGGRANVRAAAGRGEAAAFRYGV